MTTAHRRNNNATYLSGSVRNVRNFRNNTPSGIQHTRLNAPRIPSLPLAKDAVPRAGFDADDGGLSVALASLEVSPGSSHPRAMSGGCSSSIASTSGSRFERTNNVPPRHRGGGEKEYAQSSLQSPREKYRDAYFEVRHRFLRLICGLVQDSG